MRRLALAVGMLALSLGATQAATPKEEVDPLLRQALIEAIEQGSSFENRFVAEVWLMDMAQRLQAHIPEYERRLELLRQVHYEASRAGLAPELVLAVIEVESAFNRYAISAVGARGLMQIMPFWLEEIGQPDDNLFDIATNLRLGCTILRHYVDREQGDLTRALARYNGSVGQTWYPERVFRAMERRWYNH